MPVSRFASPASGEWTARLRDDGAVDCNGMVYETPEQWLAALKEQAS